MATIICGSFGPSGKAQSCQAADLQEPPIVQPGAAWDLKIKYLQKKIQQLAKQQEL